MTMSWKIVDLDVREILRRKEDPFETIMAAVEQLGEKDVLQIHATFRPMPLITKLQTRGLAHAMIEEAPDHIIVQFYQDKTSLPYFHLDNRNLEPPQPMVRTLAMLEQEPQCQNGTMGVEIWNERVPALLLPELDERSFTYEVVKEAESFVRLRIIHA